MSRLREYFPDILPVYDESTNVFQYIAAHDDEITVYESDVNRVILSHQINNASEEELRQIGKLFGEVGQQNERDTDEYRQYLQSVVPIFSGRGEIPSIKQAVGAALNTDTEYIDVEEDFDAVSYGLVLNQWTDHKVSTVWELAELADPSGVTQNSLRYEIPDDDISIDADIVTTGGVQIVSESESDTDSVTDTSTTIINNTEKSSDTVSEKTTFASDTSTSSSSVTEQTTDTSDTHISSVTNSQSVTTSTVQTVRWDENAWDSFDWDEKEIDSDGSVVTDTVSVTTNTV